MTDFYWILIGIAGSYFVLTLCFASWSETNNRYKTFGMDLTYGLLWPIILSKWLYRLPSRIKNDPDSGAGRVIRDVWNG